MYMYMSSFSTNFNYFAYNTAYYKKLVAYEQLRQKLSFKLLHMLLDSGMERGSWAGQYIMAIISAI